MELLKLMLANGFFLAIVLIILIFFSLRNGHSVHSRSKVNEDIRKIKNQITDK
jgi:hypothetical protein